MSRQVFQVSDLLGNPNLLGRNFRFLALGSLLHSLPERSQRLGNVRVDVLERLQCVWSTIVCLHERMWVWVMLGTRCKRKKNHIQIEKDEGQKGRHTEVQTLRKTKPDTELSKSRGL